MKNCSQLVACIAMMLAGLIQAQQVLNLQESPPTSGLFNAQVTDAYSGTGVANAKIWIFNAEANDRVSFVLRTTASVNSNPMLRLTNSSGTIVAQSTGTADGYGLLENVTLGSPGVYQITVFSNSTASAFSLNALLGRGISLESEINDLSTLANVLSSTPQAGGFRSNIAGVLDRNEDWSDLGTLNPGDGLNASLQTPAGSTLVTSGVELSLFKDADASPLVTATGSALIHSVTAAGRYRLRLRVPDIDGTHVHFPGTQELSLANPAALQITGSQTIEFWIKPNDFNTRQNPYAKAYAGEGTMTLETNGNLNYFYGTGGGNTSPYQTFGSGTALRQNRWQHVALVRDFSSTPKQLRWYFDGKLVAQADATHFPAAASTLPLTIGNGYAGFFRGSIDELRLWNIARSTTEIENSLGSPLTGSESGLVGYYRFSEGSGTTAADTTSNSLDGTFNAAPAWEGIPTANLADFAAQGINASYLLSYSISDTTAPMATSVQPIPRLGYVFDGTAIAPSNMTGQRGNNEQSFLYTVTGDSGGTIYGTDRYSDDSSLSKAAVHAGILMPGEIGPVRVTIKPGLSTYLGSTRFDVSSSNRGNSAGSYELE